MPYQPKPFASIVLACTAAGPIFLASTALAYLYLQLPRPIVVMPNEAAPFVLMVIPSVIVGFLLSAIPTMVGSRALLFTGAVFPATRARLVWIGIGALLGAGIAWQVGGFAQPALAFGLVFTSASCAAICRHSASWD